MVNRVWNMQQNMNPYPWHKELTWGWPSMLTDYWHSFEVTAKQKKNKTSPFTKFKAILCSFKRDTRYWYIPFLVVNSSDDERLVVLTTAFVYMTNRFVVASIFLYDRSPLMTSLHGESLRRNSERERFVNHVRSWQSELANNCITAKKPSSMKNIGLCNIQLSLQFWKCNAK